MEEFDPRSINYKRIYNKVKINYKKLIFITLSYIFLLIILIFSMKNKTNVFYLIILYTIIYIIINLKNIILLSIKIYQRLAPISIREKCRFEPSCSNYMIMSIEKYGLIKGMIKGYLRLRRCNVNNGGYDYP